MTSYFARSASFQGIANLPKLSQTKGIKGREAGQPILGQALSLLVTSLSAAFAGVAGVLAGPYLSVDPGMDVTMIVNCLIIVVIGGTGSIAGAIVAALLFGFVQVAGSVFLPDLAALAPYILLFSVLLISPRGIGRGRAPA